MKRMLISLILLLLFLSMVGFSGCGDSRRAVENECISFTLNNQFDHAFLDVNPDASSLAFPLGNQLRVVFWDKGFPNNWNIFTYYPCPNDVSDLMGNTSKKTVNGVEVLFSEYEGFYLQAYLDPTMTVGISSIDEMSTREADMIVESLKVKKSSDGL